MKKLFSLNQRHLALSLAISLSATFSLPADAQNFVRPDAFVNLENICLITMKAQEQEAARLAGELANTDSLEDRLYRKALTALREEFQRALRKIQRTEDDIKRQFTESYPETAKRVFAFHEKRDRLYAELKHSPERTRSTAAEALREYLKADFNRQFSTAERGRYSYIISTTQKSAPWPSRGSGHDSFPGSALQLEMKLDLLAEIDGISFYLELENLKAYVLGGDLVTSDPRTINFAQSYSDQDFEALLDRLELKQTLRHHARVSAFRRVADLKEAHTKVSPLPEHCREYFELRKLPNIATIQDWTKSKSEPATAKLWKEYEEYIQSKIAQ